MKKLKFAALLLPVILLSACESVEVPIVNVESATMTVGDSLYVSVRNVPNNQAYFDLMFNSNPNGVDSLICRLEVLSDTSAMVYALRQGKDLCRVYYNVERITHTDCYHIEIPITVVDSIQ